MQETSRQSWHEYKGSEEHRRTKNLILSTLSEDNPQTGRELCEKAGQEGLWKRLSELYKEGLVEIKSKRRCQITGKTALTWVLKSPPKMNKSEEPDFYKLETIPLFKNDAP